MAAQVDFYRAADGSTPVEDYLDNLSLEQRAKVLAAIKLLEERGLALPFPYSSQVEGRLRELRTKFGKTRLRILYFADSQRTFILLHGIVKDAQKLPREDIEIAKERMLAHTHRLERRRR